MDGTGVLFQPLLQVLPPFLQPTVVAFPSDIPLDYADLLPIVHDACPTSDDYVILAESFSGPLAVKFAESAGPNLRGLILCVTFVRSPVPRFLTALANSLVFRLIPRFLMRRILLGKYSTPALKKLLASALAPVDPGVLAARAHTVGKVDELSTLQRLAIPVFVLAAENDRLIPKRRVAELRRDRSLDRYTELPGPHMLLEVFPKPCADAIGEFVASIINRIRDESGRTLPLESRLPWRYSRALAIDDSNYVVAIPEKQNYTVIAESMYYSMKLSCEECNEEFWFSANEQRVWYEEWGFWIDSVPKQCTTCRKSLRDEGRAAP